jgi:glycosyltransferase involved in cell wall biosynthesis
VIAPISAALTPGRAFKRHPGLTLGIVSRLTPIKQFPRLFSILAPVMARYPQVNLEIFGSGGYASVRDLQHALAPVRRQVRYWGHQADVARVYPQLDYVLSGLPEKEALGLNLIEAQVCGTPVLAVNAPPFTETVLDGASGYLFEDPRRDGGEDFGRLLQRLLAGAARPDPRAAPAHLARFSRDAFRERVQVALAALATVG